MASLAFDRHPRALLQQRDLHRILVVVVLDLALTVYGITQELGAEANPFFAPLTGSLGGMAAGIAFYFALLGAASLMLSGRLRAVLGSVVFAMHVGGALTWLRLFVGPLGEAFNVFWLTLTVSFAAALFFERMYA